MAGLWRDFWIRETGTGQQVAQLHDRYMMMMMMMMMMTTTFVIIFRCKFCVVYTLRGPAPLCVFANKLFIIIPYYCNELNVLSHWVDTVLFVNEFIIYIN